MVEKENQINRGVDLLLDDPNWRTYKIIKKFATGQGHHGQIINLLEYSNGSNWDNVSICVGLSDINISKDTIKVVANYSQIDNNRFEIVCYTDNIIYENKIEDNLQIKENQSIEKTYKGNYFYISGNIFIHTTKDGTGTGDITYEIINSNNVVIETVNFLNIPPTKYETKSVSKLLTYDEIVTFKLKMTTYRHGPATISNSFSIFGGTKKSGSILEGKAEWLAYEN